MHFKYFVTVGLATVALFSSGCVDYGRIGMHKIAFSQPPAGGAAEEEENLVRLTRATLVGKGFEEMPGTPHIWRKGGATVQVYRDPASEWIVKIRALGSKRDIRVSEQTEKELLEILKKHSELEIRPVTPTKPQPN